MMKEAKKREKRYKKRNAKESSMLEEWDVKRTKEERKHREKDQYSMHDKEQVEKR
jgi:hypothetical protein